MCSINLSCFYFSTCTLIQSLSGMWKAHKLEKKFSEILDFDKLELFFPHLTFTLSLSGSKQQRERKCELGAGVYR